MSGSPVFANLNIFLLKLDQTGVDNLKMKAF